MRLVGRVKVLSDAEVEVDAGADEPTAPALCERLGLGNLAQPKQRGVEVARLSLATGRHGELDVIDPGQLRLPVAGWAVDGTDVVGHRGADAAERVDGPVHVARDLESVIGIRDLENQGALERPGSHAIPARVGAAADQEERC
jgi:hypothetical protein